jgi:histidine triad (HIT) family protein
MSDCIFCKILSGQLPASFVYRDEICAAFMDIQPVTPGHTLIVPNQHAAHLADLDGATLAHMAQTAQTVAASLRKSGLQCEGVNLFLADGEAAGQEVFHVHLHVLPRFVGDGFGLKFGPNYGEMPDRATLDDWAGRIKREMED